MTAKKLWIWLGATVAASFLVLIFYGVEIYRTTPPFPEKIVTTEGEVLYNRQDIKDGQNVWQSIGGQTVGSIWGHGAYIAPDWNADYLHRESEMLLDIFAAKDGKVYKDLSEEEQAKYQVQLRKELRTNTFNQETGVITFSPERAQVAKELAAYYTKLFMNDPSLDKTRSHYAIPKNAIKDSARMQQMNAFFTWTTWVCSTNRPNDDVTYTNNWPYDPVIGNQPSTSLQMWSGFSVLMLLFGVGILVYYHASNKEEEESEHLPAEDPMRGMKPTPSMKATLKYIWIVSLLILVQMLAGVITAHYGVEGEGFFGIPLDMILPQAISRSWHVQLAIFWIATSWLATGLYIAPAVSGHEPKYQKLGVNILFIALLIVVLGSLAGQWFGVMQKLGLVENFYFGHQGYEYIELGRFWQILLLVGLFLWLFLMVRALLPALRKKDENRHLLLLFVLASVAIAAFYGAGLMYGRQTHMAIAEYWRWWVVHLWVEGFFEVFSVAALSFIFVSLGLVSRRTATVATITEAALFLIGGIPGTFHHLYFSGATTPIIAVGASFSALEVVPLVLLGHEAWEHWEMKQKAPWMERLKWPIYCFVAVAFWNMLGAGVFGFLINPPISLYYIQGLNTTAVHAHAALFGVYGFLALGFVFLIARYLRPNTPFNDKLMKWGFWLLNSGLILMIVSSLLPIGIIQGYASISEGLWYARSEEFMQQPLFDTLRWVRLVGDVIFIFGALAFFWQIFTMVFFKPKRIAN